MAVCLVLTIEVNGQVQCRIIKAKESHICFKPFSFSGFLTLWSARGRRLLERDIRCSETFFRTAESVSGSRRGSDREARLLRLDRVLRGRTDQSFHIGC